MHSAVRAFIALCFVTIAVHAANYDLLLRNGRIADGTGNPTFHADVAIKDGRIVAIGKLHGEAKRTFDAAGLVIAPGFVDVHTHAEEIDEQPLAENFVRMGVTTLVLGNCGGSRLNVGEYFRQLEATNISPNVCTLIGHNTVRSRAMSGSFMRPPTTEELAKMKSLVEQAMKDGAVGLSTGLIYLPGSFAKTDEIVELAKVASAYDGIYASHMRHEDARIFSALDELFGIAREAHIRADISHIKLSGKAAWGQTDKVLAAIEHARAGGLDITQDQYVYTASSTGISTLIPSEFREGSAKDFSDRLADPQKKAEIIAVMKKSAEARQMAGYDYVAIASYKRNPSLNGLRVPAAAKQQRGSDSLDDQIELVLDIHNHGGASCVFHGMSEEDLQHYARHPNTMFASDSGVRKFGEGVPHPRGYGNNARVLGRYVRELKVLSLEDAVRRMSSLPASTYRLRDRGFIRTGAWADVVVFDPAKVTDDATFDEPHHYATGFALVLVNGVPVVENDKHTGMRPGKCLRHESGR
ncbi:MAG: D-aminoacylase [Verrucomicrobia bacterium]|nr:D-aminoacylase [Verrucomicrobiota bacterium]